MHYRIDLARGENFLDLRGFGKVRNTEHSGRRHRGAMSFLKIIQNDDVMPALQQYFRADASNVPGAAGDQNVQRHFLHYETEPLSRQLHRAPNYSRICSELQNSTLSPKRRGIGFWMRAYPPRSLLASFNRLNASMNDAVHARDTSCLKRAAAHLASS